MSAQEGVQPGVGCRRGQEVGSLLLHDAIARVTASQIGASALFAEAIDETAATFYRRHQFLPLTNRPKALFLSWATAIKTLLSTAEA